MRALGAVYDTAGAVQYEHQLLVLGRTAREHCKWRGRRRTALISYGNAHRSLANKTSSKSRLVHCGTSWAGEVR